MIDTAAQRALTPGADVRAHFNHAGSSLMTEAVLETQLVHLRREAEIGGYEAAAEAAERFAAVRESVAQLIGGSVQEVGLVENATVAWQQVFPGLTSGVGPGDRLLTARAEYGANTVAYHQLARRTGVSVEIIPDDEHGATSAAALEQMIDDRVRLVAISHVPTNGGLVNPAEDIGAVCRAAGVRFLLDACQSVGQLDVDVHRIGCDALTATGRKYLRGPRGSGFVWVSQELLDAGIEPPTLDHHGAEPVGAHTYEVHPGAQRFENWEFNHAAVLGLGVAVDHAIELGLPAIEATVTERADRLRERLAQIEGLEILDLGRRRCGICTFVVAGVDSWDMKAGLAEVGINVSVSGVTSTPFDVAARELRPLVRASVHYLTSDDEIERIGTRVEQIAGSTLA